MTSGQRDPRPVPPARIDIHRHFLPPDFMRREAERVRFQHGRFTLEELTSWTPRKMLDEMDASGIRAAIGSIPNPGVWFGDVALARKLSREWNEAAADIVRSDPKRLGFFAVVAPPDTEGCIREIDHAFDRLGADGIALMSNYEGRWLGDGAFAPALQALDERATVVFVHPCVLVNVRNSGLDIRPQVLEFPFDTTRTIASLLLNGAISRYPNIRFIFAHGGGAIAQLAGRIGELVAGIEDLIPGGIDRALGRLYYDTALVSNRAALAALTELVPDSRIVFGTDSPFLSDHSSLDGLASAGLPADVRRRIERDNALSLLPRFMETAGTEAV